MALKKIPDEVIIAAMKKFGSSKLAAEHIGMSVRALCHRKAKIQEQYGVVLPAYSAKQHTVANTYIPDNRRVIQHTVDNGHVFIASDCHYWPGEETVAHKAFVSLLTEFKPKTTIINGDCFDGARISRHAPLMGTNRHLASEEVRKLLCHFDKISRAGLLGRQNTPAGDRSAGVLLSSGYIAGGALAGIVIAFTAGVLSDFDRTVTDWAAANNPFFAGPWADLLSLVPYLGLTILLYAIGREKTRRAS